MISPIDFLKSLDPNGWHNLVAIKPDAVRGVDKPIGVTISPGNWSAAEAFVEQWNGKRNLYFSVNEPLPNSPDKKLNKENIFRNPALQEHVLNSCQVNLSHCAPTREPTRRPPIPRTRMPCTAAPTPAPTSRT